MHNADFFFSFDNLFRCEYVTLFGMVAIKIGVSAIRFCIILTIFPDFEVHGKQADEFFQSCCSPDT